MTSAFGSCASALRLLGLRVRDVVGVPIAVRNRNLLGLVTVLFARHVNLLASCNCYSAYLPRSHQIIL